MHNSGGHGSAPPRAYYEMRAQVSDHIILDDIKIGRRRDDMVVLNDDRTRSSVYIHENGWIMAFGPHALVLMTAAIALLVRTKIAPNASLADVETKIARIIGRGRKANL